MSAHLSGRSRCGGLTLIEVMVAVLVLAIGLLGIAGLQSAALANNLISYQYTQASTLAQAMIERMRANHQAVIDGDYLLAANASVPIASSNCGASGVRCSPQQQAQWDLAVLYAQLSASANTTNLPAGPRAVLPGGRLSVSCEAGCGDAALRVVTIYWDAARTGATGTDCSDGRNQLRCLRLGYVP